MSRRRGVPFVVAAPSGTGKTTVCRRVLEEDPDVVFSVSHTTRPPRAGEQDGVAYHFVTPEQFDALVAEGAFLEHAEYNENRYGTSWRSIEAPLAAGHDVLIEIEVQGARQVRERLDDARFVFLLPPSLEALRKRLEGRGTEASEHVDRRLRLAERELAALEDFDYAVFNDGLETCVADVLAIIRAERSGDTADVRARFAPRTAAGRLRRAGGAGV